MLMLRDLSQYYELNRVKAEANNLKFINSTTTHEMMTPLSCVVLFAERLMNQLTEPKHQRYATLVWRTGKLLKSYIRDLLDRSLIEKGKLTLNYTVSSVAEIVDEVVVMMQYQAESRNIKLDWDPTFVKGKYLMLD